MSEIYWKMHILLFFSKIKNNFEKLRRYIIKEFLKRFWIYKNFDPKTNFRKIKNKKIKNQSKAILAY